MKLLPFALTAVALTLGACATQLPELPLAKETIFAVDTKNQLISFNGNRPAKLLSQQALSGLKSGEIVLGIDYRVARGQLFALGSSGQLYRIDTSTATASPVGGPLSVKLRGSSYGFDFNPTVDRIRVVSNAGQNLRLHPDTGAVVDADPKAEGVQTDGELSFDAADAQTGKTASVVAAAYTYNQQNDKLTNNFAIDAAQGLLLTRGSREGAQPAVSPNSGRLLTVGPLKVGAFEHASFDISDVNNVAYAALTVRGANDSSWVRIDLATGVATKIGRIAGNRPVVGIAVEP